MIVQNSEIQVDRVATSKDLNDFIMLPWKIYKDDPNWVPPLISGVKTTLDKIKNPFFCHAERELFLARKGSDVVGRIAAIIDYNYCRYHNQNIGYFGFFEAINDYQVACALLTKVVNYLKTRIMTAMAGPANPMLIDDVGFLVSGPLSPFIFKIHYGRKYYPEFVEKFGMIKAKDIYSYAIDLTREPKTEVINFLEHTKLKKDVQLRQINLKKFPSKALMLKRIHNSSWSKAWSFATLTNSDVMGLAKHYKLLWQPEFILIAEVRGKPVGMTMGFPDFNQVFCHFNGKIYPWDIFRIMRYTKKIDALRFWTIAVDFEYENSDINALLLHQLFMNAKEKNYKFCEVFIYEDLANLVQPIFLWDAKLYRTYRTYQMSI